MISEKSVKDKQLKLIGMIAGGVIACASVVWFFTGRGSDKLTSARHYKKEIKTGADGLTPQELWVERSANEIEELRGINKKLEDQGALLKKQLNSIQKMVIGLGVHMRAFDDQQEDKTGTIPSRDIPEYQAYKSGNPYISKELEQPVGTDADLSSPSSDAVALPDSSTSSAIAPLSVDKLEEFSLQKGVGASGNKSGIGAVTLPNFRSRHGSSINENVLKSGFRITKFSNLDSEYDLDENFIFAGTYARAVLVGTIVASAGIGSSSNPEPVMLRINDTGNLPNDVKGFLKDAVVIGAAYGDLSSESVIIRLERIVKIDKKTGVGVDIPVKGYVAGENGCSKIRGMVFDRAGKVARNAAIAGFLSGAADYLSANNNSAIRFEPNSGLAQFSPQAGSKMLQQGASKGIGNAVEKYADFIIKRAEQMQPVIMIDGGRKVTIVFTESVKASAVHMKKIRRKLYVRKQY